MDDASFDNVLEYGNRLAPILDAMLAATDQTQFDPTELNFARSFSVDELIGYVTEQIRFEQYVGMLRGARGTLISGAGNALDQALLLAELLEQAGYEWRIAAGELTEVAARALVARMASQAPREESPGRDETLRQLVDQLLAQLGVSESARSQVYAKLETTSASDAYLANTEDDTTFLLQALERGGVTVGDSDAMAKLIAEARDYYWLEYRLDAYDDWQAVHVAFPADAPPAVEKRETFKQVPPELEHRFRFEVFIEQKTGSTLTVHPIVADVEATTAALFGTPMSFQIVPEHLDITSTDGIDAVLSDVGRFLPVVDDQVRGQAFDLDGRVYGVGTVSLDRYGMGDLLQGQARQLETAIGGLDDLGGAGGDTKNADDLFTITALWIDYTTIAPGGTERTRRRYAFDRIGPANRAANVAQITDPRDLDVVANALATEHAIMVVPGRYGPAFALRRYLERALAEIQALNAIARTDAIDRWPPPGVGNLVPFYDVVLASALDIEDALPASIAYRHEPLVAVHQAGFVDDGDGRRRFERVDVVDNPQRLLLRTDGGLRFAPSRLLQAGVWETVSEGAPVARRSEGRLDTAAVVRRAVADGIPVRVFGPSDVDLVDGLSHSATTRLGVREDLVNGYAVVIPERPALDVGAWWRIDPVTGETLGIVEGGYGATYTEYVGVAVGVMFGAFGYLECRRDGGGRGCCTGDAVGYTALGLFGGAILWALDVAPLAAFLIGDYTGGFAGLAAGGAGVLPSMCDTEYMHRRD